jgi:nondiscriminating glutamyl-tRNA synthetase
MIPTVRVRFAPSPTGLLHIGNARTALFNYLFAKHHHGTFVLRIEDTDLERSTEASIDRIVEDLQWLGIRWEEGPDRDGPDGPYRQSERVSFYHGFADRLLAEGRVYKCFCTPEKLASLRKEQLSKGKMPRYDGRCRSLSKEEILRLESSGAQPVLRFQVGGGPIVFDDLVYGKMSFAPEGIGDFIIVRSDGVAAYNFACVIDDHAMHITHVIRGEDHLSNTPRQILIHQALGWDPPRFAHHPLILGSDRSPLSKRHGATAVSQYREEGFFPGALLNYLVLLGWTPPSGEEILPIEKMIEAFSLTALSRSAPVHSRKKLEWLNSSYLRAMDSRSLSEQFLPYLQKAGLPLERIDRNYLDHVVEVIKDNLVVLSQIQGYLGIFFDEKFAFDDEARPILLDPENRETLRNVLDVCQASREVSAARWASLQVEMERKTRKKGKGLFRPLRAAVTGMTRGPELAKALPLLGKERIIKRLRMALEITH